jgi:hypothetical protein
MRNAADIAAAIQDIPQVHFVGAADDNVPLPVVEAYVAHMDDASSTRIVVVEGMSHNCCWADAWPDLLATRATGGE